MYYSATASKETDTVSCKDVVCDMQFDDQLFQQDLIKTGTFNSIPVSVYHLENS